MTTANPVQPRTRRFTRDEYHQMADMGFFQGQRVELIGGEIVEMSAQKDEHAFTITLVHHMNLFRAPSLRLASFGP